MDGKKRRQQIEHILRTASSPVPGKRLGQILGVSRQVIVQDMALLRTEGYRILSTARGYTLDEPKTVTREVKVRHTNEQLEDELCTVVDLGGEVVDVTVNHRVYGRLTAALGIRSRRDVLTFMENIRSGKSVPLMNVTSGCHFHTIRADSEEILDEIEAALREKNYTVPLLPYEQT